VGGGGGGCWWKCHSCLSSKLESPGTCLPSSQSLGLINSLSLKRYRPGFMLSSVSFYWFSVLSCCSDWPKSTMNMSSSATALPSFGLADVICSVGYLSSSCLLVAMCLSVSCNSLRRTWTRARREWWSTWPWTTGTTQTPGRGERCTL